MARSVICDAVVGIVLDINMDGVTIMRTPSCKLHLSFVFVVEVVVLVDVAMVVDSID